MNDLIAYLKLCGYEWTSIQSQNENPGGWTVRGPNLPDLRGCEGYITCKVTSENEQGEPETIFSASFSVRKCSQKSLKTNKQHTEF